MRRRRLAGLVTDADRARFRARRVCDPTRFPAAAAEFAELLRPGQSLSRRAARDRRGRHDPAQDRARPADARWRCRRCGRCCVSPEWRGLIRYIGSRDAEPVVWIQSILRHAHDGPPDPQTALHADTFHPTVKAWLFLTDVAADAGPFTYVPGSHRLTPERLAWERRMSLAAPSLARSGDPPGLVPHRPGGTARRSACPSRAPSRCRPTR